MEDFRPENYQAPTPDTDVPDPETIKVEQFKQVAMELGLDDSGIRDLMAGTEFEIPEGEDPVTFLSSKLIEVLDDSDIFYERYDSFCDYLHEFRPAKEKPNNSDLAEACIASDIIRAAVLVKSNLLDMSIDAMRTAWGTADQMGLDDLKSKIEMLCPEAKPE